MLSERDGIDSSKLDPSNLKTSKDAPGEAGISGEEDYKKLYLELYEHHHKYKTEKEKEICELEAKHLAALEEMEDDQWQLQNRKITKMIEYQIRAEARNLENADIRERWKARNQGLLEARQKDLQEERFHFAVFKTQSEIEEWFSTIKVSQQFLMTSLQS